MVLTFESAALLNSLSAKAAPVPHLQTKINQVVLNSMSFL
jgi:hypothetical protein